MTTTEVKTFIFLIHRACGSFIRVIFSCNVLATIAAKVKAIAPAITVGKPICINRTAALISITVAASPTKAKRLNQIFTIEPLRLVSQSFLFHLRLSCS